MEKETYQTLEVAVISIPKHELEGVHLPKNAYKLNGEEAVLLVEHCRQKRKGEVRMHWLVKQGEKLSGWTTQLHKATTLNLKSKHQLVALDWPTKHLHFAYTSMVPVLKTSQQILEKVAQLFPDLRWMDSYYFSTNLFSKAGLLGVLSINDTDPQT